MYQGKHYVTSARLQDLLTFLGAESGVENRKDGEEKLEKQVFSSEGIPPKYARVTNYPVLCFPGAKIKEKELPCFSLNSTYLSLDGRSQ